jgi:hypothetical protein
MSMTTSTGERDDRESARDHPERPRIPADTFPARLVLARHYAGRLSIEKAAERCGINSENWRRWEDGAKPRDKVEIAEAISDSLDIDFDWMLFGGPLTGSRGRSTRRSEPDTLRYSGPAFRPPDNRPPGRPHPVDSRAAGWWRRAQIIGDLPTDPRSQRAA